MRGIMQSRKALSRKSRKISLARVKRPSIKDVRYVEQYGNGYGTESFGEVSSCCFLIIRVTKLFRNIQSLNKGLGKLI